MKSKSDTENTAGGGCSSHDLLGRFVTATLTGGENGEPRQGFVESFDPLILRGESGTRYECEGVPMAVVNPPDVWDPIASYEQAEAATKAGLRVELARIDQHGRVHEWHAPAANQLLRNWPLSRWRIVHRPKAELTRPDSKPQDHE